MNSWDHDCFICGAHHLQECGCDPDEVRRAINEHVEKFKNIQPISMAEAMERIKANRETVAKRKVEV